MIIEQKGKSPIKKCREGHWVSWKKREKNGKEIVECTGTERAAKLVLKSRSTVHGRHHPNN
jgi:hypothetical protein